jgi:DUF2075 family protein
LFAEVSFDHRRIRENAIRPAGRHGFGWVGQKENSFDTAVKRSKEKFRSLVKNTYRVLLTRGMKGCFVNFQDKETEQFFRSRTERE